jgi:hypothetical protein
VVAEHPRAFGHGHTRYDPLHYLPVLARKPGALRNGAPFRDWTLPPALSKVRGRLGRSDEADRQFVDILAAIEGVDAARIVAAGHSLGAKETLYLAAFDERVRAGVFSEGGIGIGFSNWHDPWYLGAAVRDPGFPLHHAQLLALSLPRALLILGGEAGPGAADGDRSWGHVARALEVGRLREGRPRLGLLNHRGGHAIPAAARSRLLDWLATYADGAGDTVD